MPLRVISLHHGILVMKIFQRRRRLTVNGQVMVNARLSMRHVRSFESESDLLPYPCPSLLGSTSSSAPRMSAFYMLCCSVTALHPIALHCMAWHLQNNFPSNNCLPLFQMLLGHHDMYLEVSHAQSIRFDMNSFGESMLPDTAGSTPW